jgi:hypothetical protein
VNLLSDEFLTGITPFESESENPMDTYEKIMKGKYIVYAETAQAKDLIAGLLCVAMRTPCLALPCLA